MGEIINIDRKPEQVTLDGDEIIIHTHEVKSLLLSKTFWTAVSMFVVEFLAILPDTLPLIKDYPKIMQIIGMVYALAFIYLRRITSQPVELPKIQLPKPENFGK